MKRFIDPKFYLYTDKEWKSRLFEDRLQALLGALLEFHEIEKEVDCLYGLFTFRISEELDSSIYCHCPLLTSGDAASHYAIQFKTRVFPELRRRYSYCRTEECLNERKVSPAVLLPPIGEEDGRSVLFRKMLKSCGECGDVRDACLIYHNAFRALPISDSFFSLEIEVPRDDLRCMLDPCEIFPDADDEHHRDRQLHLAIQCFYHRLVAKDPTWKARAPCTVQTTRNFWATLKQANFAGQERLYRNQILYALVQICCARDVTVSEHRMLGQNINDDGKFLGKWNAYVFKMGATDIDKRCSRLYYGKSSGGILLEAYDGDVHS